MLSDLVRALRDDRVNTVTAQPVADVSCYQRLWKSDTTPFDVLQGRSQKARLMDDFCICQTLQVPRQSRGLHRLLTLGADEYLQPTGISSTLDMQVGKGRQPA